MPIYKSLLPAEYQEVEYIESTGTQYIDTGISGNTNIGVLLSVSLSNVVSDKVLFGSRNDSGDTRFTIGNLNSYFYFGFNRTYSNQQNTISANTKYDIKMNYFVSGVGEYNNISVNLTTTVDTQTYNCLLFGHNRIGVITYASYKLYKCEITNGSTIVRNFVPCYRKSDSVIGLYDTVNKVFYTNQGTGTFLKGNDVKPRQVKSLYKGSTKIIKRYKGTDVIYRGLPSAYQEVEYIESTGTQYIDTGITGSERANTPIIDISDIEFTQVSSGDQYQGFGPRSTSHYGITSAGKYTLSGNVNSTTNAVGVRRILEATYEPQTLQLKIGNVETITRTVSLVIGAVANPYSLLGTDEGYYCYAKLYSCKISIQGTIVRDFIPCYRKSDNVIGLYDLVNGVFYTNAGTGTFLKGGNV